MTGGESLTQQIAQEIFPEIDQPDMQIGLTVIGQRGREQLAECIRLIYARHKVK